MKLKDKHFFYINTCWSYTVKIDYFYLLHPPLPSSKNITSFTFHSNFLNLFPYLPSYLVCASFFTS